MTTVAPIDVERGLGECVALVDLENIRISWEREYKTAFRYVDLSLLCRLVEEVTGVPITRVIVFATDPLAYRRHVLKTHISKLSKSKFAETSDLQADRMWRAMQTGGHKLTDEDRRVMEEIYSFDLLIHKLKKDMEVSDQEEEERRQEANRQAKLSELRRRAQACEGEVEALTDEEDEEEKDEDCVVVKVVGDDDCQVVGTKQSTAAPSAPTLEQIVSLRRGGDRRVQLRCYDYKIQKGRTIQRGCDVALGAEITKACFDPRVETICLFSADSDFRDLMSDNMKFENVGGVYKFAKRSWVIGFTRAFGPIDGLRKYPLRPHEPVAAAIYRSRDAIGYIPVDVAFPRIGQDLAAANTKLPVDAV